MKPSPYDPYRVLIRRLNQKGVRYVVIGMSGINYYAKKPSESFATMDYDLFLEPTLANVQKAVEVLKGLGFTLGTSEGILERGQIRQAVRGQRTIGATTTEGLMVELLLKVSGYPFSEIERDAATFTVGGVPVRVGRLTKLLLSKKLAGRPKDIHFLRRYRDLLEEREP